MPKGILYVESRPPADRVAEYHAWYEGTHIPEMLAAEGVVAARRFAPVAPTGDDDGLFVAIYEIEGDDLAAVMAALRAGIAGRTPPPDGLLGAGPPVVRLLATIFEQD